jgi:hypothetical protein
LARTHEVGELGLERVDLRTEYVDAAVEDASGGILELVSQQRVLSAWVGYADQKYTSPCVR